MKTVKVKGRVKLRDTVGYVDVYAEAPTFNTARALLLQLYPNAILITEVYR